MKTKGLALLSLLCLLSGCMHRPKDMYQRAIDYVMPLIDCGLITDDYIHLYEMGENDSNTIYSITSSCSAFSEFAENPSRIIQYGGKFFCFIELDEPELSYEQVSTFPYVDNGINSTNLDVWFMGVSKHKDNGVVLERSFDIDQIYLYSQLRPYFSGGKPALKGFCIGLGNHDISLSASGAIPVDSLKYFIKSICGRIDISNERESEIVLTSKSDDAFVISGNDTLILAFRDSLPIRLSPKSITSIDYESRENSSFFRKLPDNHSLTALHKLLSDSTFCCLEIDGTPVTVGLLHDDCQIFNYILDDSGKVLHELWNEGVYDKDKRRIRFFCLK